MNKQQSNKQQTPQERQQKLVEDQKYSSNNFHQILVYTLANFMNDERFEKYWPVFTGEKGFNELPPEDRPWNITLGRALSLTD